MRIEGWCRLVAVLFFAGALAACAPEAPQAGSQVVVGVPPREGYGEVAARLGAMIERERDQKDLAAVSVALVDGDGVVWAAGYGEASPGVPATAQTVYRVGSVSKLFTDIAIMQLAEAGELEIDAPVSRYLPEFAPAGFAGAPITLRQLMSHRSGLVREPPVGHYFDDAAPTLAATVASLSGVPLVYEPGVRTKYSNAGVAVAGYVLEATQGLPFAEYVDHAVLQPLGMDDTAFAPDSALLAKLARGYMWGYDRGRFDAPGFELGMAPAGSMYSTVLDLARFMGAMFRRGEGENARILRAETLESMWEAQAGTGYGLGFRLAQRFGERWLGHGGAIYGFSTQLSFLPDAELGVVATSAVDGTNTVVGRVADAALELMLAARADARLPDEPLRGAEPVDPAAALALEGVYGDGDHALELDERNGRLFLTPARGGFTVEVRARGDGVGAGAESGAGPGANSNRGGADVFRDTLVVDDRLAFGARFLMDEEGLVVLDDGGLLGLDSGGLDSRPILQRRTPQSLPPAPPARWAGLIGEYGWDHNVLYVLERGGRLHALVEWFFLYPLEELSPDVYAFPADWGLYHGERLVFARDADGRATSVEAASVVFPRRSVGAEGGGTFRIEPVRPVDALRVEALGASPPDEEGRFRDSELVEVTELEPGVRLDVRYATTNNFMSSVFYDEPRVFLQRPAAEAVVRVHRALAQHGYGLLLYDGYRPWHVTKTFWDATPDSQKLFVANPANGSRHNRGAAIDLNLYDLATGEPADMVGGYDEFSPRSFPDYPGGTSRQRSLRELLRRAMEAEGFTVYEAEWWHFDHEDWRRYALQNAAFDQLEGGSGGQGDSGGQDGLGGRSDSGESGGRG